MFYAIIAGYPFFEDIDNTPPVLRLLRTLRTAIPFPFWTDYE